MSVKGSRWLCAAGLGALGLLAAPAVADDGVIEINHARAIAGGVTAGDTPGYPVRIGIAGNYRLTSDLQLANENTTGLLVAANDVRVDLNGFSIIGPLLCSGAACSATSGTGAGIFGATADGVTVENGTIRGVGFRGVQLGARARVDRVDLLGNAREGLHVGSGAWISRSRIQGNGSTGMFLGSDSRAEHCLVFLNNGTGIGGAQGLRVEAATVSGNTLNAVAGSELTVLRSIVSGNAFGMPAFDGIQVTAGRGAILESQLIGNGGAGIECGSNAAAEGCLVARSVVAGNTGTGILTSAGASAGYRSVVLSGNGATVGSGAVQLGPNLCNGSTTCP